MTLRISSSGSWGPSGARAFLTFRMGGASTSAAAGSGGGFFAGGFLGSRFGRFGAGSSAGTTTATSAAATSGTAAATSSLGGLRLPEDRGFFSPDVAAAALAAFFSLPQTRALSSQTQALGEAAVVVGDRVAGPVDERARLEARVVGRDRAAQIDGFPVVEEALADEGLCRNQIFNPTSM